MAQQNFTPIEGSTHLDARNIYNANADDAEARLSFLEERLDLEAHDITKSYGEGEAFYYSGSSYRVSNGYTLNVGETPDTNPEKVEQIVGGGAVDSVNTQTGVVVLDADDIDDSTTAHKFATQAQLDSADSALQSGDNVSLLVNDSNYLTGVSAGTNVTIDNTNPLEPIINAAGGGGGSVSDEAYGVAWDGVTGEAPSKNAVYDMFDGHTHTALDINSEIAPNNYVLTADGLGNASWQQSQGGGAANFNVVLVTGAVHTQITTDTHHLYDDSVIGGGGGSGSGSGSGSSSGSGGGSSACIIVDLLPTNQHVGVTHHKKIGDSCDVLLLPPSGVALDGKVSDGSISGYALSSQYESISIFTDGTDYFIQ